MQNGADKALLPVPLSPLQVKQFDWVLTQVVHLNPHCKQFYPDK